VANQARTGVIGSVVRPDTARPADWAIPGFAWFVDASLTLRWLIGPAHRVPADPAGAAGKGVFDVVPMGLAEGIARAAHRRALQGQPSHFEFGTGGRSYEARVEAAPGGAVAVAIDVTDRRREEGERLEAEAGFRHLVERVPAITYVAEFGASGMWRYVSPQVETVLGFTAAEWMADPDLFFSRIHPGDRDDYLAAEEQALARGRLACQYRLIARDGHDVWMRDEGVLVPERPERPAMLQGVMFDVTEQVRAEVALRESEIRYRRLVDMSPDAILVHREGRFVFANNAAARLLGAQDPRELVGVPILDIVHPDFHDLVARRARAAHEGQPAPLMQEVFVRFDGSLVDVEVAGIPFVFEGGPAGQIVVRDITKRKLAEDELRRALDIEREAGDRLRSLDEMKNTFLHAVSHELRTPLSAVLGFALTLERSDLDLPEDEARDIAGRIAANARKLERLLSDLLDLDRLDRGIIEPKLHPVDLAELVRRVVRESDVPSQRAVEVDVEPAVVPLDAAKVERIVENLLANSVRHTPAGSRVWVRVRPVVDGALLSIEDDGPGIPADMAETIFEAFVRGPAAPTHAPGVGVGLSLVGRFAQLHDGRAWVEERPGGGASFRVFLPRNGPAARD
jgi:PAS domain S-box-containing protein